ncbi:MAG: hypothetical protein HPY79_10485 [Bacteroidales bacterium]|nr:hypothetical protein [Bacteroidales bacterium]
MITVIIYRIVTLPGIVIISFWNAIYTIFKWLKYGQLPRRKMQVYGSKKR